MMKLQWARRFAPVFVLMAALNAQGAEYSIDSTHSKVGFSVRHMMITDVKGAFNDFEGSFSFDPEKGTVSNADFVVKAESVDTANKKRDDHLRSADFFDVAKHPTLAFKNSKLKKVSKNKFKWSGDLTIKGVTKPVVFDLEYKGSVKDPWGNQRAGFSATSKINRKDFGLTWNNTLESGGVVVGDEVTIQIDVEAVEKKAEAKEAKS